MGLSWSEGSTRRAFEDTGGHPALLRTYASMMHRRFSPRSVPAAPDTDDGRDIAHSFLVQQGPLLAQIVAILEDQYKDEFEILRTLALGRVYEFQELARAFPGDTAHLLGYGLCQHPSKASKLNIQLLQTYLQERERAFVTERREKQDLVGIKIGEEYKLISLISARGGYADVYKAERSGTGDPTEYAAIKVLRQGQLSSLEREVEILQQINHPNIVRFFGSGRLPGGQVYLAMEYLDGQPLRSYCTASTRPSEAKLLSWAIELLDALYCMHPREKEIRALRLAAKKGEQDSLQKILEARYGYVHRDVKPENIIIASRGPVLIDFNISVKASTPVATISATPGYLPSLALSGSWSPLVDLYQLGLTLLQVAAGAEYSGENREDLMYIVEASCSFRTINLLQKLAFADQGGFQTAYTAKRAAVAARDALQKAMLR